MQAHTVSPSVCLRLCLRGFLSNYTTCYIYYIYILRELVPNGSETVT